MNIERRHSGVLANRASEVARHVNIGGNRLQRQRRSSSGSLLFGSLNNSPANIRRQICGGIRDKRKETALELFHDFLLSDPLL